MAITIISIKEKKGTYEGRDYHNYNIFGMNPDSNNTQLIAGAEVKEFKMKADAFVMALGRNLGTLNDPKITQAKDIIGLHILPVYNEFGNVTDFTLSLPDKKS